MLAANVTAPGTSGADGRKSGTTCASSSWPGPRTAGCRGRSTSVKGASATSSTSSTSRVLPLGDAGRPARRARSCARTRSRSRRTRAEPDRGRGPPRRPAAAAAHHRRARAPRGRPVPDHGRPPSPPSMPTSLNALTRWSRFMPVTDALVEVDGSDDAAHRHDVVLVNRDQHPRVPPAPRRRPGLGPAPAEADELVEAGEPGRDRGGARRPRAPERRRPNPRLGARHDSVIVAREAWRGDDAGHAPRPRPEPRAGPDPRRRRRPEDPRARAHLPRARAIPRDHRRRRARRRSRRSRSTRGSSSST